MAYRIIEITTKEEFDKYVGQMVELQEKIKTYMEEKEGRVGQFFTSDESDIWEYVEKARDKVIVTVNDSDKVVGLFFLTTEQPAYSYNDITKYWKYGNDYKSWVIQEGYGIEGVESFSDLQADHSKEATEFKQKLIEIYGLKILAAKKVFEQILAEYNTEAEEYNKKVDEAHKKPIFSNIIDFLEHEKAEEGNHFHEKSALREKFNRYIADYIANIEDKSKAAGLREDYDKLYWFNQDDITEITGVDFSKLDGVHINIVENFEDTMKDYEEVTQNAPLVIHEEPERYDDPKNKYKEYASKYYTANTRNTIELDTCVVDMDQGKDGKDKRRGKGISKVMVYSALEQMLQEYFANEENKEVFLCSTLHENNEPSRGSLEYFGLKDYIVVKRRDGRDREVRMLRISRDEYKKYLEKLNLKMQIQDEIDFSQFSNNIRPATYDTGDIIRIKAEGYKFIEELKEGIDRRTANKRDKGAYSKQNLSYYKSLVNKAASLNKGENPDPQEL